MNVVNPTAGLFCADTTQSSVRVESGARLLLTTPSATRIYDTQSGRSSAEQDFHVCTGGRLEIFPELLIPHRGARHRQITRINVERAGELCFLETLAPGRVAHGEVFAFRELAWSTEIIYAGQRVVREKFILSHKNGSITALLAFSPHPYLATFFVIGERLDALAERWPALDALHEESLWLGLSRLTQGGWILRLMARDSSKLRQGIAAVRKEIHAACAWPLPQARKL